MVDVFRKSVLALAVTFSFAGAPSAQELGFSKELLQGGKGLSAEDAKKYEAAEKAAQKAFENAQKALSDKSANEAANKALAISESVTQSIQAAATSQVGSLIGQQAQSVNYPGNLFVFVSMSMPDELLWSYLREAHYAGASVVLKGGKRGMNLEQFINEYLLKFISADGKSQGFIIEPRFFDRYGVTSVPSIVYAKENFDFRCASRTSFQYAAKEYSYISCEKAPANSYWKVDGSVSIWWALNEFKDKAAPVDTYLKFYSDKIAGRPLDTNNKSPLAYEEDTLSVLDNFPQFEKTSEQFMRDLKRRGIDIQSIPDPDKKPTAP